MGGGREWGTDMEVAFEHDGSHCFWETHCCCVISVSGVDDGDIIGCRRMV